MTAAKSMRSKFVLAIYGNSNHPSMLHCFIPLRVCVCVCACVCLCL